MFIIPVKIKWLAYIDAAFFIFEMIATPFPFNLLPLIAMFNYFIFFGADLISGAAVEARALQQNNGQLQPRKAEDQIRAAPEELHL